MIDLSTLVASLWEAARWVSFVLLPILAYRAWAWRQSCEELEADLEISDRRNGIEHRRGNALLLERDAFRRSYHQAALERDQLVQVQADFIRECSTINAADMPTQDRRDYPPVINGPTLPIHPN